VKVGPFVEGRLLQRYKRFLADVELPDATVVTAHCANPGRMTSCTAPGIPVRLSYHADPKRKLAWSLEQTCMEGTWILTNTLIHNRIVAEALAEQRIAELTGYERVASEQRYGERSRVDFLLSGERGRCYVEVKGVTLARGSAAAFPDAVTERGRRHLDELISVVQGGDRAVMLFCVGRADVDTVEPAADVDPAYAARLYEAHAAGVELIAYRCAIGEDSVRLDAPLPVVNLRPRATRRP